MYKNTNKWTTGNYLVYSGNKHYFSSDNHRFVKKKKKKKKKKKGNISFYKLHLRNRIHLTEFFYKLEYVSYLFNGHGRFTTYMSGAIVVIKIDFYQYWKTNL
jgi:hypothetical protein